MDGKRETARPPGTECSRRRRHDFFYRTTKANSSSWWTPARPSASFRTAPTFRCRRIRHRLNFGLRTFFATFLVYRPILGLDFLSAYGLLVDQVDRQVLDLKSLKPLSKPPAATGRQRSMMIVYVINAFAYFC